MAREHIMFDKTEIVMVIVSNHTQTISLSYDKIISVTIDPVKERKFGMIPTESEKIVIHARKAEDPYVFYKSKEKEFFDGYKRDFAKFCKENRITFYDNTTAEK